MSHLSKPLFTKKPIKPKIRPKSTTEILKQAGSNSKTPKGEANYWGADKTAWRKSSR